MGCTHIDRLGDLLVIAVLWAPALMALARREPKGAASRREDGCCGIVGR